MLHDRGALLFHALYVLHATPLLDHFFGFMVLLAEMLESFDFQMFHFAILADEGLW